MNKKDKVARELIVVGRISEAVALIYCHCKRLSARICELRAEGWRIDTVYKSYVSSDTGRPERCLDYYKLIKAPAKARKRLLEMPTASHR